MLAGLHDLVGTVAAESRFSGVVRIDGGDEILEVGAFGLSNRALGERNTVETRFAIASGTKALTALAVVGLVEDGLLTLETAARSVLGRDLPLIDDRVTVGDLLAHRSGIGDYIPEEPGFDPTDYSLPVPVHALESAEAYLAVLDGRPQAFSPGQRFAYNNAGYVVLALIAERVAGIAYPELVAERVVHRAGMRSTGFDRTDEPQPLSATHYLAAEGLRTNVLHLPVQGLGDGGAWTTAGDVHALWRAFLGGSIVGDEWVRRMTSPVSHVRGDELAYGLGFWLRPAVGALVLEGFDAGISFRSVHRPEAGLTYSVLSNWTEGAWPLARALDGRIASAGR